VSFCVSKLFFSWLWTVGWAGRKEETGKDSFAISSCASSYGDAHILTGSYVPYGRTDRLNVIIVAYLRAIRLPLTHCFRHRRTSAAHPTAARRRKIRQFTFAFLSLPNITSLPPNIALARRHLPPVSNATRTRQITARAAASRHRAADKTLRGTRHQTR